MINKVILVGNLGATPESKDGADSKFTKLSLATSNRYKDKTGKQIENTEWHTVLVFGKMAEHCQAFLDRGSKVYVEGSLKSSKYKTKSGEDVKSVFVTASQVKFLDSKPVEKTTTTSKVPENPMGYSSGSVGPSADELPF